jgi:acyl-CoA reductase-like NAD-dependent aldehyde dehydrogenase
MPTLTVDNPYTLEAACTLPLADDALVDVVLDRARAAAKGFRRSSIDDRIALCERAVAWMEAHADEIARDITHMMGKPLSQSKGEVSGMAGRARHMMGIAKASLADIVVAKDGFDRRIVKEPLGVVFDLPAWNYPLLTAINVVVPAVLAGNAVIVKHSPRSPLVGDAFAHAFEAAGAPPYLVQSLHCDHPTSEKIAGDARVDAVLFTGSIYGGHRIQQAASRGFAHVGLELGGNDPAYVAADVDVAKAAASIVDGAIYNAGQSCCAVERIYVHKSVYSQFVEASEALVRAYVMGDPMNDATSLGPIAQPNHVADLEAMVADAKGKSRLVCGGKRASVDGRGRFFEPTLLVDCAADIRFMKEESFGPIVPVAVVDSDEDALAKMNDSRLGLTASVWTKDRERASKFASALECGTVYMNRCDSLDPALPWTGVKDSGRGVTLSALGFDHLTRPKAIHFRFDL